MIHVRMIQGEVTEGIKMRRRWNTNYSTLLHLKSPRLQQQSRDIKGKHVGETDVFSTNTAKNIRLSLARRSKFDDDDTVASRVTLLRDRELYPESQAKTDQFPCAGFHPIGLSQSCTVHICGGKFFPRHTSPGIGAAAHTGSRRTAGLVAAASPGQEAVITGVTLFSFVNKRERDQYGCYRGAFLPGWRTNYGEWGQVTDALQVKIFCLSLSSVLLFFFLRSIFIPSRFFLFV